MSIVVLGGGIAGLETAIYLRKYKFDVTLVSNRDYLYLYPISIWIPTSKSGFDDVCFPLEKFAKVHGFDLIIDEVESFDKVKKTVKCQNSKLVYDALVLAIGGGKMKVEGVEHAPSICGKPGESMVLKSQLDALLEKGSGSIAMGFGGNPKDSSAVRGGPAFELIFNVNNLLKSKGLRKNFELNFFAPMARPGQKMGEKAVDMMMKIFNKENIGMHFGKKIKNFSSQGVTFEDDTLLKSDLTMFIAAGKGHPVIEASGLPLNDAGYVKIDENCLVQGETAIFAVGDAAAIEGVEWRAKQGHLAEAMGRAVAYNLKNMRDGKEKRHDYREHMNIICLMDDGRGAALVFRSKKRALMIPLPFIGHYIKKGWGWYYKNSKLGRFPRIPGM